MNGSRSKRLRRIAAQQEPRKNKHGQVMYYYNEQNRSIMAGGFRGVYQTFKRAYKKLRKEDYTNDQDAIKKIA